MTFLNISTTELLFLYDKHFREVLMCIPVELQIALKDLSKVEYEGLSLESREIIESYLKCYENGRLIIPTETIKDAKNVM